MKGKGTCEEGGLKLLFLTLELGWLGLGWTGDTRDSSGTKGRV